MRNAEKIQEKLLPYQVESFKKIVRNFNNGMPFILSARTGFGKTVLSAAVIKHFYDKKKRIIFATSNNNLVYDAYKEFTQGQFKFKEDEVQIIIGKSNYIDPAKADLVKDFFEAGALEKYLASAGVNVNEDNTDKDKKYLSRDFLFDTIFDKVPLIDEKSQDDVVKLSAQGKRLEYAGNLAGSGIKITNYFYLLLAVIYNGEDLRDTLLICDEADVVRDIMASLLSDNFSIFSYKNSIKRIIIELSNLNERGIKTAIKNLELLRSFIKTKLDGMARPGFITKGQFSDNTEIYKNHFNDMVKILKKTKENKGMGFILKHKDLVNKDIFNLLTKNIENLNIIVNDKDKKKYQIFLSFSPEKGYPSFSILKGSIESRLSFFWKKVGKALLMSGTCAAGKNLTYINEILELPTVFPHPVVARNPFDLGRCRLYLPALNYPDAVLRDKVKGTEYLPITFLNKTNDVIFKTHEGKNCIVFGNSYKDVDKIYSNLVSDSRFSNVNIIKAEPGLSQNALIEKFKSEGGILVTHRGLGRGVNLPGKFLEKIYICRLPYDSPDGTKYVKFSKGKRLERNRYDMFKALEQIIGRLIRNITDEGDIYILDNRVYRDDLYQDIMAIVNRNGVLVKDITDKAKSNTVKNVNKNISKTKTYASV